MIFFKKNKNLIAHSSRIINENLKDMIFLKNYVIIICNKLTFYLFNFNFFIHIIMFNVCIFLVL